MHTEPTSDLNERVERLEAELQSRRRSVRRLGRGIALGLAATGLASALVANAQLVSFSANTPARASEVNANFSYLLGLIQANTAAGIDNKIAAGTIVAFAGDTAPDGWMLCAGQSIDQATYPELYASIGTKWGGSGTNFKLPDLRGAFLRGAGTSSLDPSSPRSVGSLQAQAYLNHGHGITQTPHSHGGVPNGNSGTRNGGSGANYHPWERGVNDPILKNSDSATADITVNASTTGGTETRPVNYAVNFIIRTGL